MRERGRRRRTPVVGSTGAPDVAAGRGRVRRVADCGCCASCSSTRRSAAGRGEDGSDPDVPGWCRDIALGLRTRSRARQVMCDAPVNTKQARGRARWRGRVRVPACSEKRSTHPSSVVARSLRSMPRRAHSGNLKNAYNFAPVHHLLVPTFGQSIRSHLLESTWNSRNSHHGRGRAPIPYNTGLHVPSHPTPLGC